MLRKAVIGMIALILVGLVAGPIWAGEKPTSNPVSEIKVVKYPPYPDVWDWQVPKNDRPATGLQVKAMDNGDIMIAFHQDWKNGKFKTVSFFGKNNVCDYEAVYKGDYTNDAKSRIPFKGNMILSATGGGWRSGGCFDALDYDITIHDESGQKLLISKKLLYIFDKPVRYTTHPHCMNGPSFNYQVAAVAAKFFRLKDGTFLLIASVKDNVYIIRFDENLQTKSRLINDKFFWMDTNTFNKFDAKYGDRAVENKRLKQLYTDLYQLMIDIRDRRRK